MIPFGFEQQVIKADVHDASSLRVMRLSELTADDLKAWAQLSHHSGADSVFACDWFTRSVLGHFDRDEKYRIFVVADAKGRWNGVIVLGIARRFGRIPVRHWRNLKNANQFLGVPLVRRGYEVVFWKTILSGLGKMQSEIFSIFCEELPSDHRVTKALLNHCAATGRELEVVKRHQRAAMRSGLDFSTYWANALSPKRRRRLRSLEKHICRDHGDVSYVVAKTAAEVERWIDEFLMLEACGWKGANGSAMASSEESASLFRDVLRAAFADKRLVCLSLRVRGMPVAMSAYFLDGANGFGFKMCFDEAFARYAPGILLLREMMSILDSGHKIGFDSCSASDEEMINSLWTERRQIVDLIISLKEEGISRRFAAIIGLRNAWHGLKMRVHAPIGVNS